jgi:endoribonuclease Dicer
LRKAISRPNEVDWIYEKQPGFLTELYYRLEAEFGNMTRLEGLFKAAKYSAEQLGTWASDRIWETGLREEESERLQRRTERQAGDTTQNQTQQSMDWIDTQLRRIRQAQAVVASYPFPKLEATPRHLNQKVLRLHSELCRYFERKTNTKCIVFVERRHTARTLCDIFERVGTPFLKPGALIGVRKTDDMNVSYRSQVLTLLDFRNGKLNCLFATSVGQEGLDIPDCNLVIRFDLYDTAIEYIQSRGRARRMDSTFVHMIENGNETHRYLRQSVQNTETILQHYCQSLPEDRCLDRDPRLNSLAIQKKLYDQTLEIPETGAKLTSSSSLSILAHFAACLNYDETASNQLYYSVRTQDRMFQAEVFLPQTPLCSVKSAVGNPAPSKAKAKQSAALKACKLLIEWELFDKNLNPTFQKRVHCKFDR